MAHRIEPEPALTWRYAAQCLVTLALLGVLTFYVLPALGILFFGGPAS
jgi:hypothetical protein